MRRNCLGTPHGIAGKREEEERDTRRPAAILLREKAGRHVEKRHPSKLRKAHPDQLLNLHNLRGEIEKKPWGGEV